jgi:hypothetical protein
MGAQRQGHEPREGVREPLIIVTGLEDGIAFALQNFAYDIPQALIPIEKKNPSHGRLLATWAWHAGRGIRHIQSNVYYLFEDYKFYGSIPHNALYFKRCRIRRMCRYVPFVHTGCGA